MTDLTREQAREQVARAINAGYRTGSDLVWGWERCCEDEREINRRDADAALTVLWPVVESLRAELAHAHTVIARHVEPLRGAVIDRHCCATCETKFLDAEVERTGNPTLRFLRFMVVCPTCGNKRCPRASHHDNPCTASNKRGQEGSVYR